MNFRIKLFCVLIGGTVILACRDKKRGQAAVDKIVLESNNNKVVLEILDLGSLQSIREFAERIKSRYNRLDLLINNAGQSYIPIFI